MAKGNRTSRADVDRWRKIAEDFRILGAIKTAEKYGISRARVYQIVDRLRFGRPAATFPLTD